jgi:hypothetical protein
MFMQSIYMTFHALARVTSVLTQPTPSEVDREVLRVAGNLGAAAGNSEEVIVAEFKRARRAAMGSQIAELIRADEDRGGYEAFEVDAQTSSA